MLLQQTEKLINEYVEQSKRILQDNLTGVYLHGSAVMGCFNPQKSDLDFIIVVNKPPCDAVKRSYMEMAVKYNALGPAKGIEMSIVLRDFSSLLCIQRPMNCIFRQDIRLVQRGS